MFLKSIDCFGLKLIVAISIIDYGCFVSATQDTVTQIFRIQMKQSSIVVGGKEFLTECRLCQT